MTSRTREPKKNLPRADLNDAKEAVAAAEVDETTLSKNVHRYDSDLRRVRGAIGSTAETVTQLNRGTTVATATKSASKGRQAATKKTAPTKKASSKASSATKSSSSAKKASGTRTRSARKASPAKSSPVTKKARAATRTTPAKKTRAARKVAAVPTKKEVAQAQSTLAEVKTQEKKLTKKLDRHTTNLQELKREIKASEKDVAKVEAKLGKSKSARQRAQKKLKSLQG